MLDSDFEKKMDTIVSAIKKAGFEPYEQLAGYVQTGNSYYITRTNNAREIIQDISLEQITEYIKAKAGDDIAKTI